MKAARADPTNAVSTLAAALRLAGKEDMAIALEERGDAIQKLKAEGYAPLQRFGKFTVYAVGPNGEQKTSACTRASAMPTSKARAMPGTLPDSAAEKGELCWRRSQMLGGVSLNTMAVYTKTFGGSLGRAQAITLHGCPESDCGFSLEPDGRERTACLRRACFPWTETCRRAIIKTTLTITQPMQIHVTQVAPHRFVTVRLFESITGYTMKAVQNKIYKGVWIEGREFRRAPDKAILMDLEGFDKWLKHESTPR